MTYTHAYTGIHTVTCIATYIQYAIHKHKHTYIHGHTTWANNHMRASIQTHSEAFIPTYKHTHPDSKACIHIYTGIHIHTYMQAYTHTHTIIGAEETVRHTYIHIHTYTHTSIPTYIHSYIDTHTYQPTGTQADTHTHTYIHTYTHTYIHTYIHQVRGRQAGRQPASRPYIHTCMQ